MQTGQTGQHNRAKTPPSWVAQEISRVFSKPPRIGLPRQLEAAGALGVCLVFVIGLLPFSHSQLDWQLTVALFAFVIAIPLLVGAYLAASKVDDLPDEVALTLSAAEALLRMVGQFAVGLGVLGVIWHLNGVAVWVLLSTLVAAQVMQGALLSLSKRPTEPPPDYEI